MTGEPPTGLTNPMKPHSEVIKHNDYETTKSFSSKLQVLTPQRNPIGRIYNIFKYNINNNQSVSLQQKHKAITNYKPNLAQTLATTASVPKINTLSAINDC